VLTGPASRTPTVAGVFVSTLPLASETRLSSYSLGIFDRIQFGQIVPDDDTWTLFGGGVCRMSGQAVLSTERQSFALGEWLSVVRGNRNSRLHCGHCMVNVVSDINGFLGCRNLLHSPMVVKFVCGLCACWWLCS